VRRDTRGTTIAEYALLLFVVLVVCAVGLKVLGITLERKVGAANKHMSGQGEPASTAQAAKEGDNAAGSGAAAAAGGGNKAATSSSDSINKDPSVAGGGRGESEAPGGGNVPAIARFALIALGVIGAAAAFFAMAKGKPAGG
jgi:Flp pilus assembly pilin Flp